MMVKRLFDFLLALVGLVLVGPILLAVMFLVWWGDRHSPFYVAPRVGRDGRIFRMVKMRSMAINADSSGVSSTANTDQRITPVGHFIRQFKIDELTQLWNVLWGDMSFVGPRPQVQAGVDLYTSKERELLRVRPGITDFASIVFSDEGAILEGSVDPDGDYNRLIRPWKSRLGLTYIAASSIWLDLRLVLLTVIALFSRDLALRGLSGILRALGANAEVVTICRRKGPLRPTPPPDDSYLPLSRG